MTTHKILIIGPAWVGDMVMAQSLFKLLKQRDNTVSIDVLAPAWSLPLLARMPEVNASIVMPLGHGQLNINARYVLGKNLAKNQYDQSIVLPNSFKSALIPWFARIPKRTGWLGEMRYILLNDYRSLNKTKYPLMIERFLALGLSQNEVMPSPYPLPELSISPLSIKHTLEKFQLHSIRNPVLALCPGAEFGPAKRWPEEHFAKIANARVDAGWDVWLFGSANDRIVTDRIMELTQFRCVNLAGQTTLEEAIDLLAHCRVAISNDSGLMHIAAALKLPLIALYGPTSAAFTPPLHNTARIFNLSLSCQPCFQRTCPLKHHRCMNELSPELILQSLDTF